MDMLTLIVGGIIIGLGLIVRFIEKKTGTSFDPYNMGNEPEIKMAHHNDRHGMIDTISPDHFSNR